MMYQKIQSDDRKGGSRLPKSYMSISRDERLLEITSDDLNIIWKSDRTFRHSQSALLVFDEIQNIDGWEKFVRRMADMKYRIDITGNGTTKCLVMKLLLPDWAFCDS